MILNHILADIDTVKSRYDCTLLLKDQSAIFELLRILNDIPEAIANHKDNPNAAKHMYRESLVKMAGLCVALIEQLDKNNGIYREVKSGSGY